MMLWQRAIISNIISNIIASDIIPDNFYLSGVPDL